MLKSILYKEWLKTRWAALAVVLVFIGFTWYDFLALAKNAGIRGWDFLWKFAVGKNSVMIENLRILPLLAGLAVGAVQFLPEVSRKRIKLTLHLPYPEWKSVSAMQGYGIALLAVVFLLQAGAVAAFMSHYLARDLVWRIVATMFTWYVAGFCSCLWTGIIILEPSWKIRAWEIVLAAGTLALFFQSSEAMAYAGKILYLTIGAVVLLFPVIHLSVGRFKEGTHE